MVEGFTYWTPRDWPEIITERGRWFRVSHLPNLCMPLVDIGKMWFVQIRIHHLKMYLKCIIAIIYFLYLLGQLCVLHIYYSSLNFEEKILPLYVLAKFGQPLLVLHKSRNRPFLCILVKSDFSHQNPQPHPCFNQIWAAPLSFD